MNKYLKFFIAFMLLMLVSGAISFFLLYYEGEKPVITVAEPPDRIGRDKIINMTFSDMKSGLRHISVTIAQNEKLHTLEAIDFPQKGTSERTVTIAVEPKKLGLRDGEATFEISAVDYSLRKNVTSKTYTVTIDTIPPQIYQISSFHHINPGGSCVTVYAIPEAIKKSYVQANDFQFRAYPFTLSGKTCYICYFALPPDTKKDTEDIRIFAEDTAGNTSMKTLPVYMKNKKIRYDRMNISKRFLEMKIPELQQIDGTLKKATLVDSFVYINETVRADNLDTIRSICKNPEARQLWNGVFLRMNNAATMARFGDRRTYYYEGKKISTSTHLGVDLASTKNAVVEASNTGKVVFTGYLGIYGNTVIIDHGLGLFSFYAHLGEINVNEGQEVTKGNPIGRTDTSGLAGGDHLHFGIFVANQFVDPQEWWDPHWIKDNVERKIDTAS